MSHLSRMQTSTIKIIVHTKNDDGGGAVAAFFVLGAAEFEHALCGGMRDFNFL